MKKTLINYLKKQVANKTKLLSANTLTETDRAALASAIEDLNALIDEVDAMDEEHNAEDVFKAMKEDIDKKIAALSEKIEEKPIEPQMKSENYLSSKNALSDWMACARNSQGKAENFIANWKAKLSENSIAAASGSEAALLPTAVKGIIMDAWEKPSNWLREIRSSGAKKYMIRTNTSTQTDETSRAKGHKATETKGLESLTITAKTVDGQFIYKIMDLSNEIIWQNEESLIDYITKELVDQILWEIQRAVLVGDGRSSGTPDYRITSIEKIVRTSSDNYVTVQNYDSTKTYLEQLVNLVSNIDSDNITLFMTKSTLNDLRKVMFSSDSTPQYVGKDVVAEQIGCAKIVTTNLVTSTYPVIAADLTGLVSVGDITPTFVNWENYLTNTQYFRYECVYGCGIEKPKSCAVLYNSSAN